MESGQYQRSTGGRVPDWYRARPPEVRGDDFYLSAFSRLSTCRQFTGNGFGPIPYDRIALYAAMKGLQGLMAEFFCDVIFLLDGEYRDQIREDHEKEEAREKRANRRKSPKKPGARRRSHAAHEGSDW